MLKKYNISTLKCGTKDIRKLIIQYNFIKNKDYQVGNVSYVRPQGGTAIKNEYYLHPRVFKMCLMRLLKTKMYAHYYILLEECIKHYNNYQIKLKKRHYIHIMSKSVNNFFESITNSSNPQYIGQSREPVAATPGNSEAYHQSLPPLYAGQYNTSFIADKTAGSGNMFQSNTSKK